MIIGLDIGTQSLKAVVVDEGLAVLGRGSHQYTYRVPQPGHAEQDPQCWLDALGPAISAALKSAGVSSGAIEAIGVAGQLDGCVAVDAGGVAIGPALIWMDRRAGDHLVDLDPAVLQEITGQVGDPSHMAPKMAWLKQHYGDAASRFHQPTSFVLEALCGEAVFDPGHASTTLLYDQRDDSLSGELLDAYSLRPEELPSIAEASSIAGNLSERGAGLAGLDVGTALCVGTGDDFATPLGAGLVRPGVAACVLGTAEVVGAVSPVRTLDPHSLVETHSFFAGRYFIENPGWLAGASLRWASEVLAINSAAELDRLASTSPPGAAGVTFLPALSGSMAPRWEPSARGCFYGLSAATTRADMARSVLEGCAFAMRDVLDRLSEMGVGCSEIVLLGGGSRSALWAQIRADASSKIVGRADEFDSCAVGAAMLAAIASGVHSDIDSAGAARPVPVAVAEPAREMEQHYQRYRELFSSLEPMFVRR